MKPLYRIFIAGLLSLVLIIASAWVFRFEIAALLLKVSIGDSKAKFDERSPEPHLKALNLKIEADRKALASEPFFTRGTAGDQDAASFLNPLVGWDNRPGPLTLSESAKSLLQQPNGVFLDLKPDWGQLNLDFSWFKTLHQYDVWSYDMGPPRYDQGAGYRIYEMPIPEYGDLLHWVKLRLLKGRDDRDPLNALKDVRQLARLVMTHESLVATMVAVAILHLERRFFETLAPKYQKSWTVISDGVLEAAKRYYWAQTAFVDLRLSDQAFEHYSKLEPGICQRVSEGLSNTVGFRRLLNKDRASAFARLQELERATVKVCRAGFVRRMWQNPRYQGLFKEGDNIFNMTSLGGDPEPTTHFMPIATVQDLERHPVLAVPLSYLLLTIAEPNFLKRYIEEGAPAAAESGD